MHSFVDHTNPQDSQDFTPICYSTLFRNSHPDMYVEIKSSKSFSKSNQKKLKLINDSKSLQKSSQPLHQKRKIRPLRIKPKHQNQDSNSEGLCSIKHFKAKINRITQQSNLKSPIKFSTQNTDISESIETAQNVTNLNTCQKICSKATLTSLTCIRDPFPTLASSLVIQQKIFNPDSLFQTLNSIPSHQVSFGQSPKSQEFQSVKKIVYLKTPQKQQLNKDERTISTKETTEKKERVTLSMARNVETHETLKTENDGCISVVEENEYKRFFQNLAFPDYFSPNFRIKENMENSAIRNSFNSCLGNSVK